MTAKPTQTDDALTGLQQLAMWKLREVGVMGKRETLRQFLLRRFAAGVSATELVKELAGHGVNVARNTIYHWLDKFEIDIGRGVHDRRTGEVTLAEGEPQ